MCPSEPAVGAEVWQAASQGTKCPLELPGGRGVCQSGSTSKEVTQVGKTAEDSKTMRGVPHPRTTATLT